MAEAHWKRPSEVLPDDLMSNTSWSKDEFIVWLKRTIMHGSWIQRPAFVEMAEQHATVLREHSPELAARFEAYIKAERELCDYAQVFLGQQTKRKDADT